MLAALMLRLDLRPTGVLLFGAALGCGPTVDLDEGSGSGDETVEGTTAGSAEATGPSTSGEGTATVDVTTITTTTPTTTDDTDSGPSDTTASPPMCPMVEGFFCDGPLDCTGLACGYPNSPFDEDGCMRAPCSGPEDCADGEECHTPQDFGGCVSSGMSCEDDPRLGCLCISDPDCGGSFCLDADLVPPVDCRAQDVGACFGAGCALLSGRVITDAGGGSCLCDLPEDLCVYVPPAAVVTTGATLYVAPELGAVVKLPVSYDPAPFGWILCDDQPSSTLCQCAAVLPCDV